MRVRKNWLSMTTLERETYLQAVLTLKNTIANPLAAPADRYSIYDQFVLIHQALESGRTPIEPSIDVDLGHQFFHFLPWHRKFLLEFENALNVAVPGQNIAVPYWDWTDYAGLVGEVLVDAAFGPANGTGSNDTITTGYFALNAPTPLPGWWPLGLTGWSCRFNDSLGQTLRRSITSTTALISQTAVREIMLQQIPPVGASGNSYFYWTNLADASTYGGLWWELETGPHNGGHNWFTDPTGVGAFAHMSHMFVSPNDPMFFLHHSQVDRIWAMWQRDGHGTAADYEAGVSLASNYGHLVTHALFPWVGAATGWTSPVAAAGNFPDFSAQPATTIADVLNHRALGYAYDTEPVVGLALDRTGSMTGVTPDPATGAPSTQTKWEVAVEGVAGFLQDCEAARDAGEAMVTAGVETFRQLPTGSEFDKPLTPDYAVVKTGSTSSRAAFETAVAGMTPSGGTPIAGALQDTETNLVRGPYGGAPAGETRYLSILTDGKETAGPPLNTMTAGQLADTIIFAMGFGVGSGWNGVDYTMVQTITEKGKAAPMGVDQVFHGENAGVVNKFYTNSVAAAIGYVPVVDPVAELQAGHQTSVPFSATAAERSFLLTIAGTDQQSGVWSWALRSPDGTLHDTASPGGLSLTEKRHKGRITIFMHRNGVGDAAWNGIWMLLVGYHVKQLTADSKALRMGRDRIDLLLPSGVGMPLQGPRFANGNKPAPEPPFVFTAMRALPQLRVIGEAASDDGSPRMRSNVAIDIFARTAMPSSLVGRASIPFAGAKVSWLLDLDTMHSRKLGNFRIRARLTRPGYNIGDAYLDLKTIPVSRRKKFVNPDTGSFDEVAFLAAYEAKRPNAFPILSEDVTFEWSGKSAFMAVTDNSRYPGAYRIAVLANGHGSVMGQADAPVVRLLNASVALGVKLDSTRSSAVWHWRGPGEAVIVFVPQDTRGNIPSPARMPTPTVELNGRRIRSEHVNDYSGTHQLLVDFDGKKHKLHHLGQYFSSAVRITALDDEKLAIDREQRIRVTIHIGQQQLSVMIPERVSKRGTTVAVPAASAKAFKWEIGERVVHRTTKEALASGHVLEDDD